METNGTVQPQQRAGAISGNVGPVEPSETLAVAARLPTDDSHSRHTGMALAFAGRDRMAHRATEVVTAGGERRAVLVTNPALGPKPNRNQSGHHSSRTKNPGQHRTRRQIYLPDLLPT